jgi:hypothetical protein
MQPKDTPSLGDLPSELLLEINEHLSEADRNALARTNREIYGWINHILYCDNIRHNNASALRMGSDQQRGIHGPHVLKARCYH